MYTRLHYDACFHHLKNIEHSSKVLSQDGKIAVASSITVFIVASILFFVVGFLCVHFYQKKRKSTDHDNVQPKQYELELELKANVAYGPIHVVN